MKLDLNAEKTFPEIKILSIVFRENLFVMPNQSSQNEDLKRCQMFYRLLAFSTTR